MTKARGSKIKIPRQNSDVINGIMYGPFLKNSLFDKKHKKYRRIHFFGTYFFMSRLVNYLSGQKKFCPHLPSTFEGVCRVQRGS